MGWARHPDGHSARGVRPLLPAEDRTSEIVGVGARCVLGATRSSDEHSQSFQVREFLVLANGHRVELHDERGFTLGAPGGSVREGLTRHHLVDSVLGAVLPDDDGSGSDDHPWSWLAELAQARGLQVTAARLAGLSYQVVLDDTVTQWLTN